MNVVIMRGISGAGKTNWVETVLKPKAKEVTIVSADDFFFNPDGKWIFKRDDIHLAHWQCLRSYTHFLVEAAGYNYGEDLGEYLVVDNTNTTILEIAPYYRLAEAYGIPVKIVRIHCDFDLALKRNQHGVPAHVVWRQYQNILTERLPFDWKEEIKRWGSD